MAQKNESRQEIEDLKDLMVAGKLVIGTDRAIKGLKDGTIARLYLARKSPAKVVEDIEHYSKMSGCEVIQLDITNEELGVICKKPFLISVVSVFK